LAQAKLAQSPRRGLANRGCCAITSLTRLLGAMFREQYKRIKELGSGSFGTVYLVQHRDDKDVLHVAKTIKLPHISDKEREAALHEASYLQKVSHPNVIAYVTCFLEEKRLHIVMEYADKGDLGRKIKRRRDESRPLSESSVMRYVVQLALALEHVHSHKILHRDVKPMNIFLTGPDEKVKLGDFGVARIIDSQTHGAETQIGTPYYLPPEVLNMEKYGNSSELWALGVVMYELMALHVPFNAPSLPGVAMQICGADPAPLPRDYSKAMRHTTLELLNKVPAKRPGLKDLLRSPQSESDVWAVAVRRQREKLIAAGDETPSVISPVGSSSSDPSDGSRPPRSARRAEARKLSDENSSGREEGQRPSGRRSEASSVPSAPSRERLARDADCRRAACPQPKDPQLRALELARLDALEDRRMARQRALSHRSSVADEMSVISECRTSQAPPSSARSRSNTVAAGGGMGARAEEVRMHALARASREAADQRSVRLGQSSSASTLEQQRPQSARPGATPSARSSVASRPESRHGAEEHKGALRRASCEAAEDRKRFKAKFEHGTPAWMHDISDRHRLVACA